jgi:hypothetical protein
MARGREFPRDWPAEWNRILYGSAVAIRRVIRRDNGNSRTRELTPGRTDDGGVDRDPKSVFGGPTAHTPAIRDRPVAAQVLLA